MVSISEIVEYVRENGVLNLFKRALYRLNLFGCEKRIFQSLSLEAPIPDIKPLIDVQIRKAKITDIEELHEMPGRYSWNRPSRKELKKWILNDYPFFLAIAENKIVGYFCISLDIPLFYKKLIDYKENADAWGQDTFVLPSYRRKRIYSALGIEAMKYAKALGYKRIFGTVYPDNISARSAHKKVGHGEIKEIKETRILFLRKTDVKDIEMPKEGLSDE